MPRNEKTLHAFDRYQEFLFDGRCWRVEAPDDISMDGVLEINAEEDYVNRHTDDLANEMKNGLVIEKVVPTPNSIIQGETFIKPKIQEKYMVDFPGGTWKVKGDVPVTICPRGDRAIVLTWNKSTHGEFTLIWTSQEGVEHEKEIVVESLF